MITGKNHIIAYFESVGAPYYAIFYKGKVEKGNAIYRNDKNEDKDYSASSGKESFEKTLQLLDYGEYTLITGNEKNVTSRGGGRVDFRVGLDETCATPSAVVSGPGPLTLADVERLSDERFEKLMAKREAEQLKEKNKELEKEIKELEKKVTDPWNVVITKLAPHTDSIISGFTGKRTTELAVSGVNADHIATANGDGQKICEDFIEVLSKAKPTEWQSILVRFTTLIKDNPSKFETALNFL